MKLSRWLKDQFVAVSIAVSNVQKTSLGQEGRDLSSGNNKQERKQTQSNLLQALLNGEVTQEVRNLRWRTYKIIKASKGLKTKIVGWTKDEDGQDVPIVETSSNNFFDGLSKVTLDNTDNYPLEMLVRNDIISYGLDEVYNLLDDEVISSLDYSVTNKGEKPIKVSRIELPQFRLEEYSNRVNIRRIDDTQKMIEFYISIYPTPDNRSSNVMCKEMIRIMEGKRSPVTDITGVGFVTYNTLGAHDFLQYDYTIEKFDKIVKFDGYYIVKFIATVTTNGEDLLEKYREVELDVKYDNKEKKNITL